MSRKETHKFYKPGTLPVKGTKISLKTQPYINGILFNPCQPIESFHMEIATIKHMLTTLETVLSIPGLKESIPDLASISYEDIGVAKLLLDYLAQSPIEIILKEQTVDGDLFTTVAQQYERQ